MLHIEEPIISIGGRTKHGNSFMEMILPTLGDNNLPLYAAISFYDGHAINADFSARPHIILTISDSTAETIRKAKGYVDVIIDAIECVTILSYDKEKRAALSVIAQQTRLGNITEAALEENLSLFNEKVKKYSVILIPTGYVFRLTAQGHVLKLGVFRRVLYNISSKSKSVLWYSIACRLKAWRWQ